MPKKNNSKTKVPNSHLTTHSNYNLTESNYNKENDHKNRNEYFINSQNKRVKYIKIKKLNSKSKKKKRFVKFEDDSSSSSSSSDEEEEVKIKKIPKNRAEVENALRNRLFGRNRSVGVRRNKSVDNR
jgi:penicillin V acylase-like amidase (Ntn superfamily)